MLRPVTGSGETEGVAISAVKCRGVACTSQLWTLEGLPFRLGSEWAWVGWGLWLLQALYRRRHDFILERICLFSDKKNHICPHSPANLKVDFFFKVDFYNLILEKGQQLWSMISYSNSRSGLSSLKKSLSVNDVGMHVCECMRVCA